MRVVAAVYALWLCGTEKWGLIKTLKNTPPGPTALKGADGADGADRADRADRSTAADSHANTPHARPHAHTRTRHHQGAWGVVVVIWGWLWGLIRTL